MILATYLLVRDLTLDADVTRIRSGGDSNRRFAPARIARHALGDRRDHEILERAPKRPCAELGIVAELRELRACAGSHLEPQIAREQTGTERQLRELELDDLFERARSERLERDDR